jgi:hypothetical protein
MNKGICTRHFFFFASKNGNGSLQKCLNLSIWSGPTIIKRVDQPKRIKAGGCESERWTSDICSLNELWWISQFPDFFDSIPGWCSSLYSRQNNFNFFPSPLWSSDYVPLWDDILRLLTYLYYLILSISFLTYYIYYLFLSNLFPYLLTSMPGSVR